MIDYEEPTLQKLLSSDDGDLVGHSIQDLVASQIPFRVLTRDGGTVTFHNVSDTVIYLREMGWRPGD